MPQYVVRASEIGHPCERYLVHSIVNWADRKPHDPELEFVFQGGRMVEDLAIKDLEKAGFRVYRPEPDKAIMESRPRISAHLDVRVDFGDGVVITGEIKGLNILDFDRLNCLQDFFNSKKSWIRKYPAQLITYLYIKAEEEGFFYIKSIPRFKPKIIPIKLDLVYMESLLQKTERVENHVANNTLPERIDDYSVCEYCAFDHVCLPPMVRDGLEFIDDLEFLEMVERRAELYPVSKEFDEIDKFIKKKLDKRERVSIGNFLISGKWIHRNGYTVEPADYIQYKFTNLG
jgi:hypothetical protein